jgi:hypothetical protein
MEIRIALSKAIAYFADHLPNEYNAIEQKVNAYFEKAESLRVTQNLISDAYLSNNATVIFIEYILGLLLGLPFFIIGYVTHVVPVAISQFVSKIPKDIEYKAPLLMGVATFLIPLFYFIEIYWFDIFFENTLYTILFGISLPICGAFVWLYRTLFIRFKKLRTFLRIQKKDPDYVEHLKTERESILKTLEEAKTLYSLQRKKQSDE